MGQVAEGYLGRSGGHGFPLHGRQEHESGQTQKCGISMVSGAASSSCVRETSRGPEKLTVACRQAPYRPV